MVRQCQQALKDISTRHAVGLYWVPGHVGERGNEIADRLSRNGSAQRFVGAGPFLGVSRQIIRRKMKRCMEKQHLAW
jgi:ribonuclease HI